MKSKASKSPPTSYGSGSNVVGSRLNKGSDMAYRGKRGK
jgi:hypothetical protein